MDKYKNGSFNHKVQELIANHTPNWTLERPFYTDPEIFELDMEKIFRKYWLYVGHISQIPNPGDYFLRRILNESLIIIRDDNNQVHALYNICRHRGSQVCWEETGHVGNLVCPYHAWVYGRDGALKHARLFPKDFDRSQFGLNRAPVKILEGFIFLNLSDEPVDFEPMRKDVQPLMKYHDFGNAKVCHTRRVDVKANWKILAENYRECYHCGPAHPELRRTQPFAAAVGSPKHAEEEKRLTKIAESRWRKIGLLTEQIDQKIDTWHHVYRLPLAEGFLSHTVDGQMVAPLMGQFKSENPEDVGFFATAILPTFTIECSADHAVMMGFTPKSPTVTEVYMEWLVRGDATEGIDYNVEQVTHMWNIIAPQDWRICEGTQVSLSSDHYQSGPYAEVEGRAYMFIEWYLRSLE